MKATRTTLDPLPPPPVNITVEMTEEQAKALYFLLNWTSLETGMLSPYASKKRIEEVLAETHALAELFYALQGVVYPPPR